VSIAMLGFEFDQIHVFYFFAAASAVLFAEGVYLLFYSGASYRSRINRRLSVLQDQTDRESILVQLRRERGLSGGGNYRLPFVALNKLIVQSGVTIGLGKLVVFVLVGAASAAGAMTIVYGDIFYTVCTGLFCTFVMPLLFLSVKRRRRQKAFGAQFPDALDIIVRSLRAGHPVPVAVAMVGRELPDPIGTEFGIVSDEITYGADLEGALRNLYSRVGQEDLPLFVTAVAIQGSTGGNLSEILENLSAVIRDRFKMRRKIRALAAEGRASALILSSLPIAIFIMIQIVAPEFYRSVWHYDLTKFALAGAAVWMGIGNFIMFRMVNFRI
jgi:tight adherence protein B